MSALCRSSVGTATSARSCYTTTTASTLPGTLPGGLPTRSTKVALISAYHNQARRLIGEARRALRGPVQRLEESGAGGGLHVIDLRIGIWLTGPGLAWKA